MRAASLLRTAVRGLAGHNEAASIPQTLLGLPLRICVLLLCDRAQVYKIRAAGLSARGLPACLRQLGSRSTSQLTVRALLFLPIARW